jgi:hypothetical protein
MRTHPTAKSVLFPLLLLALSSLLPAAPAATKDKSKAYEKSGKVWALGEVKVVGQRDKAHEAALRAAAAKAAALLEAKDSEKQARLAEGLFNAVQRDSSLASFGLGMARLESVIEERWEAPDGKEAWSVRLKFSVLRR